MIVVGEVSAGRQALEGAAVAPGNERTLSAWKDPDDIRQFSPDEEFDLDVDLFLKNVRTVRRGAAPGPSGMTADHVRVLLDNDTDGAALGHVATLLARSRVFAGILQAIRCGRVTALQKPDGGVRGNVVDTLRRMVARTMAQQFSAQVEVASSPHQYALKTKVGCETMAHIQQVLTELDEEATVVSVDGIGAFDLISRNAMMSGLRFIVDGDVRALYVQPSSSLWDEMLLFVRLGQHSSLSAVVAGLREGERLFTHLDDFHVVCKPDSSPRLPPCPFVGQMQNPSMWNKSGTYPPDCARLQRAATDVSPEGRQWCGEETPICTLSRGIHGAWSPFGHPSDFLRRRLRTTVCCGIGFPPSLTRSRRGSSCPFALQPDPISSCAPSTRRRQTNSQQPTTVVCGGVCA